LADLSPGGFDVTWLSLSEEMFELGEDLFDRIEVGARRSVVARVTSHPGHVSARRTTMNKGWSPNGCQHRISQLVLERVAVGRQ